MECLWKKISSSDRLVLGAIQIMTGVFCIFMWYLLFTLYWGQDEGVFGLYEPITYKTASPIWGVSFIISGVSIIRSGIYESRAHAKISLVMNLISTCIVITIMGLTIAELSSFHSLSYRNFGKAKLGRKISATLITFYVMEFCITTVYSCSVSNDLRHNRMEASTSGITEASF